MSSAIGLRPLGDGALVATLESLVSPALLVRRDRVVYANHCGRKLVGATASWLGAGRPSGFATITPLAAGGLALELVLPFANDAGGNDPIDSTARDALPPSLARVARLMARGASDKEIKKL